MFDKNYFKKSVKEWIKVNPEATIEELVEYCESQIPPAAFQENNWLIDQTINWYKHILSNRKSYNEYDEAISFAN